MKLSFGFFATHAWSNMIYLELTSHFHQKKKKGLVVHVCVAISRSLVIWVITIFPLNRKLNSYRKQLPENLALERKGKKQLFSLMLQISPSLCWKIKKVQEEQTKIQDSPYNFSTTLEIGRSVCSCSKYSRQVTIKLSGKVIPLSFLVIVPTT